MLGAAPISVFQLLALFAPVLGIFAGFLFLYYCIRIIYKKTRYHQSIASQMSLKLKVVFGFIFIVALWNIFVFYVVQSIYTGIKEEKENQAKRSRFILPVDYKFDEFIFPKGTRINSYNVHDAGEKYRYLTLTGLEVAKFPQPLNLAGVKATAIRMDTHSNFQVELSEDQEISPVYQEIFNKQTNEFEIKVVAKKQFCKKGQRAEFFPIDGYYSRHDYSERNDWFTIEDEIFAPSKWRFKGCVIAPPIHLKAMYPLPLKYDYENMSIN